MRKAAKEKNIKNKFFCFKKSLLGRNKRQPRNVKSIFLNLKISIKINKKLFKKSLHLQAFFVKII